MINSNLKSKGETTLDKGHYYCAVVDKSFWIVKNPQFVQKPNSNSCLGSWTFQSKKKLTDIPLKKFLDTQVHASNRTYASLEDLLWSLYALDYDDFGNLKWFKYNGQVDLRHVSHKFSSSKTASILNTLHSAFAHDGMIDFYRSKARANKPGLSKIEIYDVEDNLMNDRIGPYMFIDFEQKKAWHFLTTNFGLVSKTLWQRFLAGDAKLIVQEADFDLLETSLASISSEEFEEDLDNGVLMNIEKY